MLQNVVAYADVCADPEPYVNYASYRIRQSTPLDTDFVNIELAFSDNKEVASITMFLTADSFAQKDDFYGGAYVLYTLTKSEIVIINGERELVLRELSADEVSGKISSHIANSYLAPQVYYGSVLYKVDVPMEFFSGESGSFKLVIREYFSWNYKYSEVEPKDDDINIVYEKRHELIPLSYEKDGEKIYFSQIPEQ